MTTYNWNINTMDRLTSDGYVTTVHYTVTAQDGDYNASTYGTVGFESGTPETPYASLTEAQVIAWVKDKLGEQTVEASLQAQIDLQKNPVSATGVPW
jgi:hypothetical protein